MRTTIRAEGGCLVNVIGDGGGSPADGYIQQSDKLYCAVSEFNLRIVMHASPCLVPSQTDSSHQAQLALTTIITPREHFEVKDYSRKCSMWTLLVKKQKKVKKIKMVGFDLIICCHTYLPVPFCSKKKIRFRLIK